MMYSACSAREARKASITASVMWGLPSKYLMALHQFSMRMPASMVRQAMAFLGSSRRTVSTQWTSWFAKASANRSSPVTA